MVGNKIDLFEDMTISEEEARRFAEKHKYKLLITTAKENPKEFKRFIENLIREYNELYPEKEKRNEYRISFESEKKERNYNKGCCGREMYFSFHERYKARVFQWYIPDFKTREI